MIKKLMKNRKESLHRVDYDMDLTQIYTKYIHYIFQIYLFYYHPYLP